MNDKHLRILNVEDSNIDAELCWRELERAGLKFVTERVWSEEAYQCALRDFSPDIILCDFSLPGAFDGFTALSIMQGQDREVPFIFVSGTIGEDRAVEALKRGATDYVLKDRMERLTPVVMRALREAKERASLCQAEDALRESEARFRQLAENIHDVFFLLDARNQSVLYVSPAYEEIWGKHCSSLYENPAAWEDAIHHADRDGVAHSHAERDRTGSFNLEYRIVREDDSVRWISERTFPIHDAAGRLQRIAGVASDITLRKKAEARIERLNHIYAVLSGINTLIVRATDRDSLLREACRIAIDPGHFSMAWIGIMEGSDGIMDFVAHAGDSRDYFNAMPRLANETHADERMLIIQALRSGEPAISNDIKFDPSLPRISKELEARGIESIAAVPLHIDGDVIGVLALYAADAGTFDDEEVRLLIELAGDISFSLDYLAKREKLHYLALYDMLTGLPNRALFTERLNQQLSTAGQNEAKVAVILGDVRRFRLINESLGRQAGDMLLRAIAERVQIIWPTANNVAHIHADCFAGTLVEIRDEAAAAHALETTLKSVTGSPFMVGGNDLSISMAAGIAVYPADGTNAETLINNAEAALKQAKAANERYLFYQPSMNATVADILLLESKLRKALENKEFVLHYQPKLELATGAICGLEALIRWNDPVNGLIAPDSFIPLLEETGLILEVGAWAIRRALADHRRWHNQGLLPPRIAVNVSAIQLRQANFVDTVREAIGEASATPHGLDLEITETLIMEDIESSIFKFEQLRDMNVNIAIDDFGTGYSSFSYLARLPVQLLKIDRSFIATMTDNPDSMTIVSTMISLAHTLKLKVIAEGVEQEEQSRLLRLMKCDEVQGYLFSRPLPFDQVTALLEKG